MICNCASTKFVKRANSRLKLEEERISELGDRSIENVQSEEQRENRMKINRAGEKWKMFLLALAYT